MDTAHYVSPVSAGERQHRCLSQALDHLDPEWSDPGVCRAELERLATSAEAIVDGLESIVARMELVANASLTAAMVRARGDEYKACELHDELFGGRVLSDLLVRLGGLG